MPTIQERKRCFYCNRIRVRSNLRADTTTIIVNGEKLKNTILACSTRCGKPHRTSRPVSKNQLKMF
jgi:hypothetical protein